MIYLLWLVSVHELELLRLELSSYRMHFVKHFPNKQLKLAQVQRLKHLELKKDDKGSC